MADCARTEPTIDEILADPTVKALMKADRVNPDRLQSKLLCLRRLMARQAADREDDVVSGLAFAPRAANAWLAQG
ncbi:hypothetical protein GCM10011390_48020 [Aureimonas endophytica]|uniref:Uncharacterized protein n=1 Tax=Aureimonas endophytica TaxID=2027858 RepID=A0A917ECT7_9HYPH|nr:hypothetical protein [Aureimonas endophytica]GGE22992.1 hypothetical protein GCM10011390_48020 [Aureimonas endophytica]